MKKKIIVLSKVILSFVLLFLLYLIHFVLDELVFKKALSGILLEVIEIFSAFVWSFIGGYITAKLVKESRFRGVVSVSIMTFLFMMLNYPDSSESLLFFWISSIIMVSGIIVGGCFFIKKFSKK